MTDHGLHTFTTDDADQSPADSATSTRRRDRVGDALGRTATRLHATADDLSGKVTRAVDSAADALDSTGQYVRDFDGKATLDDLTSVAKRPPGKALMAAAVLGFVAGRALRGSDT